jgi:hypothetical protein
MVEVTAEVTAEVMAEVMAEVVMVTDNININDFIIFFYLISCLN